MFGNEISVKILSAKNDVSFAIDYFPSVFPFVFLYLYMFLARPTIYILKSVSRCVRHEIKEWNTVNTAKSLDYFLLPINNRHFICINGILFFYIRNLV